MLKLLIVFHDSNYYSGATRSMLDLVASWIKDDVQIAAVFPQRGSALDFLKTLGIECFVLKYFSMRKNAFSKRNIYDWLKGEAKKTITILLLLKHIQLLKGKNFDYIYTNSGAIYIGHYLSSILHVRHIWHVREFGRIDQERVSYDGEKNLYSRINNAFIVIAISEAIKTHLVLNGVSKQKIRVVYDDVLYKPIQRSTKAFADINQLTALTCGGIQKNKGHLLAIRAIEKLNKQGIHIKLLIAGDTNTEYFNELNEYVNQQGINNLVSFCGFVTDMNNLRSKCDIGIVASNAEPFGRITIEGMLSGLLMIGSNSAGTAELINNGNTGFLFEKENVDSLCEKIVYALNNGDEIQGIILKARVFANSFTNGRAAVEIMNILNI